MDKLRYKITFHGIWCHRCNSKTVNFLCQFIEHTDFTLAKITWCEHGTRAAKYVAEIDEVTFEKAINTIKFYFNPNNNNNFFKFIKKEIKPTESHSAEVF